MNGSRGASETAASVFARTTATVAGTLLAAAGSVIAAAAAARTGVTAGALTGEPALLLGLLAVLTAATALACAYLTVIGTLATVVLVSRGRGAAGRRGLTLLGTLAPSLARRIAASAMVASAASGLSVAVAHAEPAADAAPPAVAAVADPGAGSVLDDTAGTAAIRAPGLLADHAALSAALLGTTAPALPADDEHGDETGGDERDDATVPSPSPSIPSQPDGSDLPPLGWAQPAPDPGQAPDAGQAPTSSDAAMPPRAEAPGRARPEQAPRIVVVERGDCLWDITDDLLGPAPDADADVAAAWPILYETNRTVIGADPDHIEPGQRLTVPAGFPATESASHQEPR
ncbi:hypothetical protein BRM3_08690 [Brachybacterium huguangmaarense]|uniref:LysM domain-containing protein n=1 Tax=Brachybacterium huguangmaarense TaxID=1652028 RepID=A0ABY6FY05_9MICO|nr:hypothetical protein [Brachybacterium huguangmaarense]UYG15720.1 hypothetical protein BRM3_08690 [Brachybacterium huguangmaarense]